MDPKLDNLIDLYYNILHVVNYIPNKPKFLCVGNEGNLCINSLKKDSLIESKISILESFSFECLSLENKSNLDILNSEHFKYTFKDYPNLVFISETDKEKVLFLIRNILNIIRPEVVIIDEYNYKHYKLDSITTPVSEAIYESSDLIRQYDYILEATNRQYVLVRRDCYSKVSSE